MKKISLIIIIFVMSIILIDSCKNIEAAKEKRDRNIPCSILDEVIHVTHDSISNPSIFSSRKFELFYTQDSSDEYAPVFVPNPGGLDTLYFVSSKIFKIPQRHSCFWDIIPFGWLFGYKPEPVIDNFVLFDKYDKNNNTDIKHRAEVFYATRVHSSELLPWEDWSKPNIITSSDKNFNLLKRGPLATQNGKYFVISSDKILYDDDKNFKGHSEIEDLYEITNSDGIFDKPKPINSINIDTTNESQPSLSPDGNTLFFVSDRDGGKGGMDIWYSKKGPSGWELPKNLESVNTSADETYPNIGKNGNLYFSSNRDKGLGGFDIYIAEHLKDNIFIKIRGINGAVSKKYANINNIYPNSINTTYNEISPFETNDGKYLYYSSNKPGGWGKYDLYACKIDTLTDNCKHINMNLMVELVDSCSGNIKKIKDDSLKIVKVEILNKLNGIKTYAFHNETVKLDINSEYTINVLNPRFRSKTISFVTGSYCNDTTIRITCDIVGSNLGRVIISDGRGIPYFITGYWKPLTTGNWKEFQKIKNRILSNNDCISENDFPYEQVVECIDEFFQKNIYDEIKNILPLIELKKYVCEDSLLLRITIDGYTDSCGLDYNCFYNDKTIHTTDFNYIIPNNQRFVTGQLRDRLGNLTQLNDNGQTGNVVLSMLRAYYTKETIHDYLVKNNAEYAKAKEANQIVYIINGKGIYNNQVSMVPTNNIIPDCDISNPFVKKDYCPRNDPQKRRIEISLDAIPIDFNVEKQEIVAECCTHLVEMRFNSRKDAQSIKNIIENYSSDFFKNDNALFIENDEINPSIFRLFSKNFTNRKLVNDFYDKINLAMDEFKMLNTNKIPVNIIEECNQYVVSLGTFISGENAAKYINGLAEAGINGFEIFHITSGTDRYSVRSEIFRNELIALKFKVETEKLLQKNKIAGFIKLIKLNKYFNEKSDCNQNNKSISSNDGAKVSKYEKNRMNENLNSYSGSWTGYYTDSSRIVNISLIVNNDNTVTGKIKINLYNSEAQTEILNNMDLNGILLGKDIYSFIKLNFIYEDKVCYLDITFDSNSKMEGKAVLKLNDGNTIRKFDLFKN